MKTKFTSRDVIALDRVVDKSRLSEDLVTQGVTDLSQQVVLVKRSHLRFLDVDVVSCNL